LVDSFDCLARIDTESVKAHPDGKAARTQRHTSAPVDGHIGRRVRAQVKAICDAIDVGVVIGDSAPTDSRVAFVRIVRAAVLEVANAIPVHVRETDWGARVYTISNPIVVAINIPHATSTYARRGLFHVERATVTASERTITIGVTVAGQPVTNIIASHQRTVVSLNVADTHIRPEATWSKR
jgi:hypothetical protein